MKLFANPLSKKLAAAVLLGCLTAAALLGCRPDPAGDASPADAPAGQLQV